jgi:CheY-like chemotaxis protein
MTTKALVIDDNRNTADSLCQMLSLLDVQTTAAYSPRGAFLLLQETLPDIVFVDLNMPGVTGHEVVTFVRRDPNLEHIPVVVVTSDDQEETAQQVRKEGALEIIIKPATFEAVEAVLKKAKLI